MKLLTQSLRILLNCDANYLNNSLMHMQSRNYAAKKKVLTDAQIQLQKHAAEMGFKEKTTIRGTLYEFNDVETSIKYMRSEGKREEN